MLGRADMALENPGPPVNMQAAGSPVTRHQASAMCIAAASCLVSMNWTPSSSTASTRGSTVSPTMVNIRLIPSCFRARTNRCDPVSLAMV